MKLREIVIRTKDYGMFSNTQDILSLVDHRMNKLTNRMNRIVENDHYESKSFCALHYRLVLDELRFLRQQINSGSYIVEDDEK